MAGAIAEQFTVALGVVDSMLLVDNNGIFVAQMLREVVHLPTNS